MKLVSFQTAAGSSWGLVDGDLVHDLAGPSGISNLKSAIEQDALKQVHSWAQLAVRIPLADIRWLPVIEKPAKILCVGHNYETHRQETGRAKADHPSIFIRFADSQIGHQETIVRPAISSMLDYEGELAVVVGRGGRNIDPEHALEHVAGYSIYNDASVRDWQWHTSQFAPGKNFPGTGAFGPWLVTSDDISDPSLLRVTTRLNGVIMQDQPTSDMLFPVPTIIAYVSRFTHLNPGDVIVTGTPGGVGAKRDPAVWLKPGDLVEVAVPGIGVLSNTVGLE